MKRDDPETTEDEIMEIEKNVEEVLDTILSQEAQKMETFRLLNDEKASKPMINLEKSHNINTHLICDEPTNFL